MPKKKNLSEKQRRFIESYVICLNATKAARDAGYNGDNRSLAVIGHDNLRKINIRAEIDRRFQADRISADEVLKRLVSQATSDVDDVLNEDGTLDLEKARELGKTHLIKKYRIREGPKSKATGRPMWTETEAEMYPADQALDRIAKILGMDKHPIDINVNFRDLSDDELDALIEG